MYSCTLVLFRVKQLAERAHLDRWPPIEILFCFFFIGTSKFDSNSVRNFCEYVDSKESERRTGILFKICETSDMQHTSS